MGRRTVVRDSGKIVIFPIVLSQGKELILDFRYKMGINAYGFSNDTPYDFLTTFPKRTLLPPKSGNFCWTAIGHIELLIGNRWNRLSVKLDDRKIIGIGKI